MRWILPASDGDVRSPPPAREPASASALPAAAHWSQRTEAGPSRLAELHSSQPAVGCTRSPQRPDEDDPNCRFRDRDGDRDRLSAPAPARLRAPYGLRPVSVGLLGLLGLQRVWGTAKANSVGQMPPDLGTCSAPVEFARSNAPCRTTFAFVCPIAAVPKAC